MKINLVCDIMYLLENIKCGQREWLTGKEGLVWIEQNGPLFDEFFWGFL